MTSMVRGLRGATTVEKDEAGQISERVQQLLSTLFERNQLSKDDLISVIFTATPDITSMFPATAARELGLGDIPLLCARELDVAGATPLCIRVLMHITTDKSRDGLHHVYLEGATDLRDDLAD